MARASLPARLWTTPSRPGQNCRCHHGTPQMRRSCAGMVAARAVQSALAIRARLGPRARSVRAPSSSKGSFRSLVPRAFRGRSQLRLERVASSRARTTESRCSRPQSRQPHAPRQDSNMPVHSLISARRCDARIGGSSRANRFGWASTWPSDAAPSPWWKKARPSSGSPAGSLDVSSVRRGRPHGERASGSPARR